MAVLSTFFGIALIVSVLWEAFEVIILPRRVTRRFRFTRLFYRTIWRFWSGLVRYLSKKHRETYLSIFGPLSLLLLLSVWAAGMILGFALVNWGTGSVIKTPEGSSSFSAYLYLSGTSFFTLGLGDVTPLSPLARVLTVLESGLGFGFLALVIAYLPALNQSFSRRETNIALLDARAGSPPTASEMLRRRCHDADLEALRSHLNDWERWSAELLESHLSYPVLAYFRSQHDNQSWLAALTTILDISAFAMAAMEGACQHQAQLTFAIARHTIVDLSLVFRQPPLRTKLERLSPEEFKELRAVVSEAGLPLRKGVDVEQELTGLRHMYEPYVHTLSRYFLQPVPPWIVETGRPDNWQTSSWERGSGKASGADEREHF